MFSSDDHLASLLPGISRALFRLFCVVVGAKIIKAVYRPATNEASEDAPTFATHWRKNARDAIFGVAALGLLFYIVEGGNITVRGVAVLFVSTCLLLFVTGETILGHWGETLDAIEALPGPFILKVAVGVGALLLTAAVCIFYVSHALRDEW